MKIQLRIIGSRSVGETEIDNASSVAALLREKTVESVTIERTDGHRYRYARAAK